MSATGRTYKVPGTFFEDHMSRHYGDGPWAGYDRETERWSGRCVYVTMTDDQRDCLADDADFYADGGGGFGSEYRGLMSSAAATLRSLAKQRAEVTA